MKSIKELPAVDILHQQGFGSKKACAKLIYKESALYAMLENNGNKTFRKMAHPNQLIEIDNLFLKVEGLELPVHKELYIAMHKPLQAECSHQPTDYPSVFSYLPEPFLNRKIQAIGRLDTDTSGLLLLTADGDFNHRLTSPKKHVTKTYQVEVSHPITQEQLSGLKEGVLLHGETLPTLPAQAKQIDEKKLELIIVEGRYHQVKRMLAAVGNKVIGLHRSAIGNLQLEASLVPGQWRWLTPEDFIVLGVEPKK